MLPAAGGAFGIGTDSNTLIDPFAKCASSNGRSDCACAAQRAGDVGGRPVGQRCGAGRKAARRRCAADRHDRSGRRADLIVLDADDLRLPKQPLEHRARRCDFRSGAQAGARRDGGGRLIVREGQPCARAGRAAALPRGAGAHRSGDRPG
jgi:hypothetical protein